MQSFLLKIDSFCEFLVRFSIAVRVIFLTIPLFIFLIPPFFVYRTLVVWLARRVGNPHLCKPLDLSSATTSHLGPIFKDNPYFVILPMVVSQSVLEIGNIKEAVREKLLRKKDENGILFYPELLQTLEYFMGYPFWSRIPWLTEDKALDKYVRVYQRPGGWDATTLLEFVKGFAKQKFKKGEPLWGMAVLDDYIVPGSRQPHLAIVARAHHSLTDGVGFLSVIQDLGSNQPKDLDRIRLPPGYHIHRLLSPIYRGMYDTVSAILNALVFFPPNSLWPESRSTATNISSEGIIEFSAAHSFSLGNRCATLTTVRKVAKAWGVSGTTVIITALLRSVRNTLFEDTVVLPSYLSLIIPVPCPEHSGKLTNKLSLISPVVPLYVENPAAHARLVDKEFQTFKKSSIPFLVELLMTIGGYFPRFTVQPLIKLAMRTGQPECVSLSTIIGPKESPTIFGHTAEEISYLMPPPSDGQKTTFFQLLSVADKLYLNLTADKSLIKDDALAGRVVMAFHDEIDGFQDLCHN